MTTHVMVDTPAREPMPKGVIELNAENARLLVEMLVAELEIAPDETDQRKQAIYRLKEAAMWLLEDMGETTMREWRKQQSVE